MSDPLFSSLDRAMEQPEASGAWDELVRHCLENRDFPLLFETRLMQARQRLGLPLMQTPPPGDPKEHAYQEACRDAALETGRLFLKEGNLAGAWPYLRAVGETEPVRRKLDKYQGGDDLDSVIEIAFMEGVHPWLGFQLILEHHGTCRAITCFSQYPDPATRQDAARLLIDRLHTELTDNLRRAIEQAEGKSPEGESIPQMVEKRDWLFGEFSYYVDTSHLLSVMQIAADLDDDSALRKALDMAIYGQHLSPAFHHRGEPPFEDPYASYALLYRALLGDDVDAAREYFSSQARQAHHDRSGTGPAQVLVNLLARLKCFPEAIDAFEEFLSDADPQFLGCPNSFQLCEMSGDYERFADVARRRGDITRYVAAKMEQARRL